ncbi:MAG: hypothetical protein ABI835_15890, partial [Chloroflexota bacterium]
QLIDTALPMLRRITGERIRNELTLMLREADPAGAFLALQARGILQAIHPEFLVPDNLKEGFDRSTLPLPWTMEVPDPIDLRWCLLLENVPLIELASLCERLLFSKTLANAILATAKLIQHSHSERAPSQIVARLDGISDLALFAAWLTLGESIARTQIQEYAETWRRVRPKTDGRVLQARGLNPGPCYSTILARLRSARLDGEISSDAEEERLLESLLEGGICDDGAR